MFLARNSAFVLQSPFSAEIAEVLAVNKFIEPEFAKESPKHYERGKISEQTLFISFIRISRRGKKLSTVGCDTTP